MLGYIWAHLYESIILFFKIITRVYSYCIFAFMTYFCHTYGLFNGKSLIRKAKPNYDIVLMGKYDCFMSFQEWFLVKGRNCALKDLLLRVCEGACAYKTPFPNQDMSLGSLFHHPGLEWHTNFWDVCTIHGGLVMEREGLQMIICTFITYLKNKSHIGMSGTISPLQVEGNLSNFKQSLDSLNSPE